MKDPYCNGTLFGKIVEALNVKRENVKVSGRLDTQNEDGKTPTQDSEDHEIVAYLMIPGSWSSLLTHCSHRALLMLTANYWLPQLLKNAAAPPARRQITWQSRLC